MKDEKLDIKQVIVIRKDLKMRRGKEIAQGAHASMLWWLKRMEDAFDNDLAVTPRSFTVWEEAWMTQTGMKKITVSVNSEAELLALQVMAENLGVEAHIVTDSGLTEFNGVPTRTALAIGPAAAEKIDPITGKLPLY